MPAFIEQTKEIMLWLQTLSYEELKKLWACNDKIAQQNYERLSQMDLYSRLTPAILSYDGIAYRIWRRLFLRTESLCMCRKIFGFCRAFMGY